jgi:hypothetical protein
VSTFYICYFETKLTILCYFRTSTAILFCITLTSTTLKNWPST